jgi:hypothetical protein
MAVMAAAYLETFFAPPDAKGLAAERRKVRDIFAGSGRGMTGSGQEIAEKAKQLMLAVASTGLIASAHSLILQLPFANHFIAAAARANAARAEGRPYKR